MKKLLIGLIVLLLSTTASSVPFAWADWEVTVSGWTASPGPDLAYENVQMDNVDVSGCSNILPAANKSCVFTITDKTDQVISIVSYDSQGDSSEPNIIGNIGAGPDPSSGGVITIIWK